MKAADICTGCFACADVCPMHCISLKTSSEGFYIPEIDKEKCINCGKCDAVCSRASMVGEKKIEEVVACQNIDTDVLSISSSGGVFYELAQAILKTGGVVFGASIDPELEVTHKMASNTEELLPLLGSKYVQSATYGIYKKVETALNSDIKVLFSGTPCQVAALYAVVGDNPNLYTVDFVCHGVPAPGIWKNYCLWIEDKYGKKIKNVNFRDKKPGGWNKFAISFSDDEGVIFSEENQKNIYMQLFLQNKILREACYQCLQKTEKRHSDLTMADYWAGDDFFPERAELGISALLINSEKGRDLLNSVKHGFTIHKSSLKEFAIVNRSLLVAANRPNNREVIIQKLMDKGFGNNDETMLKRSKVTAIKNKVDSTVQRIRLQKRLSSFDI